MSAAPVGTVRRRRLWWIAAVIAVAALVAGVVGWSVTRDHERLEAGDRVEASVYSDQLTSRQAHVPVAFGELRLTIATGAVVGPDDDPVRAPEGTSLVQVSWAPYQPYTGTPVWPDATAAERRDPGARITLVTDGHRYPLADAVTAADEGSSALLVVAGDASDIHVESRFGGRAFTSAAGSPAARQIRGNGYGGCDEPTDRMYAWVRCTLPVHRGVYVPGLGVAPAGKEWLLVLGASASRPAQSVHVYDAAGHNRAEYLPTGTPTVSVTVEGVSAEPRIAGEDEVLDGGVRVAARAWLVPADSSSTVRMDYRLPARLDRSRSDWPGAPERRVIDVSTTTTYPAP